MSTIENHKNACDNCLTHAWQMNRLAPWIQNTVSDQPGNRTLDLLNLPIESLIEKVGLTPDRVTVPDPSEMRDQIEKANLTAICQHDDRYPIQLHDLAAPPKVLFCAGDASMLTEVSVDQMVAIVGARKGTGYGLEMAVKLGRDLSREGVTVVSGMSLGIAGAAHRGALQGGRTIAVLPCGADRPYPPSHTRLYKTIRDQGVVISEVIPAGDAWRWSFPARNRIVAALAGTTVVAEAGRRSGSLTVAEVASELGRPVRAVPGPVTSVGAAGTNNLIKEHKAQLIETAADVKALTA